MTTKQRKAIWYQTNKTAHKLATAARSAEIRQIVFDMFPRPLPGDTGVRTELHHIHNDGFRHMSTSGKRLHGTGLWKWAAANQTEALKTLTLVSREYHEFLHKVNES